jgi:hypothetical protein
LAAIKAVFEALSGNFEPNTDLSSKFNKFELTWAWAYGDPTGNLGYDQQDTLLGDLAAGTATIDSALYNLDIDFDIKVTVTQID